MTLSQAVEYYSSTEPRGEYVLILRGAERPAEEGPSLEEGLQQVQLLRQEGLSLKDAVKQASRSCGIPKNTLYEAALSQQA